MGNTGRVTVTVKVNVHLMDDGRYAVGIVTSEWQGATRLDRRFARVHRHTDAGPPLEGVDRDVWRAYHALRDLVCEQQAAVAPPMF